MSLRGVSRITIRPLSRPVVPARAPLRLRDDDPPSGGDAGEASSVAEDQTQARGPERSGKLLAPPSQDTAPRLLSLWGTDGLRPPLPAGLCVFVLVL